MYDYFLATQLFELDISDVMESDGDIKLTIILYTYYT